ncbi:MAG: glycine cleavage T C-terminal barrel domain-containing protein, partial [Planctomycetota bacterium]
ELGEGLNPIEAGLEFGVSFHKKKEGTLGREALLAVRENPKRKLMGLVTDGPRVPRQGYVLKSGDEEVGFVCSGSVSPTLDTNIGSAYVDLAHAAVDTALELDIRGKRQACKLVELPFYSRTRS